MKERREWDVDDVIRLKLSFSNGRTRKQISTELNRPLGSVDTKLQQLGLAEERVTFDKDEDKFIEDSREINFPWRLIAEALDRRINTIKGRYRKLKLTNPRRYDKPDNGVPQRRCAMHRGWFQPSHSTIFVCDACKDTEEWKNGTGMG